MEKRIAEMKDLKVGRYVMIDNEPCRVSSVTHSKPGKHGGAKARIDAVGIFDGQKRSLMGPVSQRVEIPIVNKKTAQVLNIIGDRIQLMDMENYETFELEKPSDMDISEGASIIYVEIMGRRKILKLQ